MLAEGETGRRTVTIPVGSKRADLVLQTVDDDDRNADTPTCTCRNRMRSSCARGVRGPVELGRVSASDPGGGALTYGFVSGDRSRFRVGAADGSVTYAGSGEDFESGPKRFALTVRVRDAAGGEARAAVAVTVANVNEAPEARDDTGRTDEDRAVVVDVLSNDTDGDSLRVASVSAASHGTAELTADGRVRYTPRAQYHGADRFTYVAADGAGETSAAAVEVTVAPVNDAPEPVGTVPDQKLNAGGGAATVDLEPYFEDADGDALTYRAEVSDAAVATAVEAGSVLTLTPVAHGSATVTVTAEDGGGLTATQAFSVGVTDALQRAVLSDTLAGMARSHLSSARMTLGRRTSATAGNEEPRLTVMGRPVPLGKAAARAAAAQMASGWLTGMAAGHAPAGAGRYRQGLSGLPRTPFGGAGTPGLGAPSAGGMMMAGPAAGGMMAGPAAMLGLHGSPEALVGGTEFLLNVGAGEGAETRPGRRWQVWEQGDVQTFSGAPSASRGYDGDVRTLYVGADTKLSDRWLAGVAVSRSGGGGDWRVGGARGRMTAALTAVHPYVRWSDGTTSVWALGCGGWGEADNVAEAAGRQETSDLGLRLGLVELRRRLGAAAGGMKFGRRADAAWAELGTDEDSQALDGLTAAVDQQRVGAEVSRALRGGGLSLEPFGAAHLRRDGGAGQTGTGVELAFGVRATGGIVRLDAQGRVLAVHSATGYRERGAGVSLSVGDQGREGLRLSVSPRWGDVAAGGDALWREQVYRRYLPGRTGDQWAVDARGDYGMRLPTGGLLTWFGSFSHSPYGRRFTVGGSLGGLADAPCFPAGKKVLPARCS